MWYVNYISIKLILKSESSLRKTLIEKQSQEVREYENFSR